MSLKTVKNSYNELLKVFESCGVKMTSKNKKLFESFISDYANTLEEAKKNSFKKGILFAESKIKPVVESILKHQTLNQKLSSRIQNYCVKVNESKKMAVQLDKYLSEVIEESIPNEKAIDYAKLNKYETLIESLKTTLAINDSVDEFKAAYEDKMAKLFKENAELKRCLQNKDILTENSKKEVELAKGRALLEEKAAKLPAFEAKKVKEMLKNLTEAEIEERFDEACAKASEEAKDATSTDDSNLEEDVNNLIENVMSETKTSDKAEEENQTDTASIADKLNESHTIYSDQMQLWMNLANRITPIG